MANIGLENRREPDFEPSAPVYLRREKMDDLKFRELSLDAALRTATLGDNHEEILDRARDYYQYLSGKSPDHRPPPKLAA
jgi:hypothetical protein